MASIEKTKDDRRKILNPNTGKITERFSEYEIFTISASVGTGMANHFGDVLIVQALLRYIDLDGAKLATSSMWKVSDGAPDYYAYEPVQVTGIFDKNTEFGIKLFQNVWFKLAKEHDGIVRPAPFWSTNDHKSTIYALNDAARHYNAPPGGQNHIRIIAELFPQVLAAVLI